MKEIGGYLEFENLAGKEYYPDLMKLNLGRTAAVYFLSGAGCSTVYVPDFLCASVTDALRKAGFRLIFYRIRDDFRPDCSSLPDVPGLSENEWLYVVNAYGQLTDGDFLSLKKKYGNVLADYTHAFFQHPLPGIPTLYSVRKFFGVTDGAYLSSDRDLPEIPGRDFSNMRFAHILGRYEEDAGSHYRQMLDNAHSYEQEDIKQMSALTQNLLGGFDYGAIAGKRLKNYQLLSARLSSSNPLASFLRTPDGGPFAYPYYTEDGITARKKLAEMKIFVPTNWSNVIMEAEKSSAAYRCAANILCLPCDQRYDGADMEAVADAVLSLHE